MNKLIRSFAVVLILCSVGVSVLYANPFTGGARGSTATQENQASESAAPVEVGPSSVRISQTDPALAAKQGDLRSQLADGLSGWKATGDAAVLWTILGVSFLYGMLHALGPGHRKTVVFSLYLARPAPVWEPAAAGLILCILHGGSAVVILLLIRGLSGALSGHADSIALWMEGGAYLFLIIAALVFAILEAIELVSPDVKRKQGAMSLGAVLVSGLYPCPGAVLVLILSLTLDIIPVGVLAVGMMSAGMSVPVIAAGYLAWFGRTGLFLAFKNNAEAAARLSAGVALAGYIVLLVFAVYIAQPFLVSLVRLCAF